MLTPVTTTTHQQLVEAVTALPAPAAGAVRVFRGQTKDHGSVLSSFGRVRKGPSQQAFDVFMRHLFVKSGLLIVLGDLLKLPALGAIDVQVSASNFVLAEALVQHYGYQTRYIDVTPSLDVALWFALHEFQGHIDTPVEHTDPCWLAFPAWYVPNKAHGMLYVFDVNPWNRVSSVQQGEFIDLVGIAPQGLNRPRRQIGGVLYAPGPGETGGDISNLLRAKFEVAFPWRDVGPDWDTDYLFPGPAEDVIYATLLRAPFFQTVRRREHMSEETIVRRTFSLPEYYNTPDAEPRRKLYRGYYHRLQPTLYYPWLRRNINHLRGPAAWDNNFQVALQRSVPIMLQRPNMLFSMHRGGPAPAPDSPPNVARTPFQNFFLEFSPENFAIAYDEQRMHRGVWCVLFDSTYSLTSFGTRDDQPWASEIRVYEWQSNRGLVQTLGSPAAGSYVSFPLDLIQMTFDGLLRLDPPGNIGHGYYELTTTDRFWPALSEWTDLM